MTNSMYSSFTALSINIENQVAKVSLNRPEKLNSLNPQMLTELSKLPKILAKDKSIRVIWLTGNGKDFSSGLDFASVMKNPTNLVKLFTPNIFTGKNIFQKACLAWRDVPVPVICLINGRCWGGGLQLAMGCDFRYAEKDASLSILETKWGLIPDMSGTVSLSELASIDKIKELTMTGEEIDASTAKDIGFITDFGDASLLAQELTEKLLKRSPSQLAATKKLWHQAFTTERRRLLRRERIIQLKLLMGKNSGIARKAGMNKTEPQFLSR